EPSPRCSHARGWVMSTAPSLSALRSSKHSGGGSGSGSGSADPAWTSALSGNSSGSGPGPGSSPAGSTKPFVHAVPPSDPLRQANRLPIKVLKMLTARTGHILHPDASACSPGGMLPSAGGGPEGKDDKKDPEAGDGGPGGKALGSDCGGSSGSGSGSGPSAPTSSSVLGSGLVAPVSPYKPGQTVFPLPPAGMTYPGSLAGAYAGYPPQFLPHGVALDPTKPGSLVGAQLAAAAAGSLGCSKPAGSSPLAGASPPSVMTASLCRDPYCLSYHCASHLAGAAAASASCAHDPAAAAAALKSGYPLVYPTHPLHGRFATSEELLSHLRTHTAFPGTDKLLSGYPSSSSLASAAAAAMACHMHIPTSGAPGSPGTLALRSPHHALGLSSRYHPYSKSPLPTPGAP
ncbi:hypothetical protein E2I00_011153, partial [Balaenoptera physalus]